MTLVGQMRHACHFHPHKIVPQAMVRDDSERLSRPVDTGAHFFGGCIVIYYVHQQTCPVYAYLQQGLINRYNRLGRKVQV
jgi:hypothetical protein